MTTTSPAYQEDVTELATGQIHLHRGGSGSPVVVLHHEIGTFGWMPLYEQLAQHFSVYVPDLPGFGTSTRLDWARHPRDLATVLNFWLDKGRISPVTLVGLGFGGWIAAEMAAMNQQRFDGLVLVAPMGIQPRSGEIMDQMLMSFDDYLKSGFHSIAAHARQFGSESSREQRAVWGASREATARIAWKPYMFSHQLPHLLTEVATPTLVVWGRADRIVPVNCGELFVQSLPNARLEVIESCGHFVDVERPQELCARITAFVGRR